MRRLASPRYRWQDACGIAFCRQSVAAAFLLLWAAWVCPLLKAADPTLRLPQEQPYQIVLRDHLQKKTVSDYAVPFLGIHLHGKRIRNEEALHRLWVLSLSFPDTAGLSRSPEGFLLSNIESPEGVRMPIGRRVGAMYPDDTVWWSTWDYHGNPYRGSRGVMNRAFAMAAVDMMMLDRLHESGSDWVANGRRSDFLGGSLARICYVYRHVRGELPGEVQEAFEVGLARLFQRLSQWGPTAVNDDMDMTSLAAIVNVKAALRTGPTVEIADAYIARVLRLVHPCGMIRDAGGLECSYNGIALNSLIEAASESPEVLQTVRRISDLKGHLNLPEPDGANYFGPSHFSTRTGADSANDQWSHPHRDIAIAMRCDEARYLMFGGRAGRGPFWGAPNPRDMRDAIARSMAHVNVRLASPPQGQLELWQENHWSSGAMNVAYDTYVPGFYERLVALRERQDPLCFPPVHRGGTGYIRAFPDENDDDVLEFDRHAFVTARFPGYACILYSGPTGRTSYMNFGGAGLSAFWTPDGGSILLGRNGHSVEPEAGRQTWADWRVWPTHAIGGVSGTGKAFSSARVRGEVSSVDQEIRDGMATVVTSGPLGTRFDKGRAVENGALTGEVSYVRRFDLGPKGIVVETHLESDGVDSFSEVCEILPLFIHDSRLQIPGRPGIGPGGVPHRVRFQIGKTLVDPPSDFVDGVSAVHVDRFGGGAVIRFETPQRVQLGEAWSDSYQTAVVLKNLLIDLLGPHEQPLKVSDASVRYRIEPLEARDGSAKPRSGGYWRGKK